MKIALTQTEFKTLCNLLTEGVLRHPSNPSSSDPATWRVYGDSGVSVEIGKLLLCDPNIEFELWEGTP